MPKPFASSADTTEQKPTLEELADGVYAYTAQGDPNLGAIIGPDSVICIDARATPAAADEWLAELRQITDKPVEWLVLSHYHAVRTLGASAFAARHIVCHSGTANWISQRGSQDWESEQRRMPRLFRDPASIPGLTYPDVSFADTMTLTLGSRRVELRWLGHGHTVGDTAVWLPDDRILFAGDLVEANAAPYAGDAVIERWSTTTLNAVTSLGAETLVPGRGPAVTGAEAVSETIEATADFLSSLWNSVSRARQRGATRADAFSEARGALEPRFGDWWIFEHVLPFNVARAYDEAGGLEPQIWTAENDAAIWEELQD
jgi:glyoxylase-like metal-dependent hydrolase (beta-lactamase superfamily II)